jgi:hypothetical protein
MTPQQWVIMAYMLVLAACIGIIITAIEGQENE